MCFSRCWILPPHRQLFFRQIFTLARTCGAVDVPDGDGAQLRVYPRGCLLSVRSTDECNILSQHILDQFKQ
ncbi:hypothetical protein BD410DRAFT_784852 [Rickenella mellea]|uniref:Uncharacterized protein n=1 Tax=Rickenella mellea TaxID=50990 RepID=A0A4Y7QER2_9AGAM|nr:hypothetical protein BD410DRAFT_784852 [Rickenella mellea]